MKKNIFILTFFFLCVCILYVRGEERKMQKLEIVPAPENFTLEKGNFIFKASTVITVEDTAMVSVAEQFASLFNVPAGFTPQVKTTAKAGDVCLRFDSSLKKEAYRLVITPKRINVYTSSKEGAFYAFQSLRQLLPSELEGGERAMNVDWSVPVATVNDSPRFGYRGVMIDVARYFIPKEDLLRLIDCISLLKINTLHLHLTDDNGWRIEIKKHPLLTAVGSRRVEREGLLFHERHNQRQGEPTVEKGFYTQTDIREIVAYASSRCIEIIPEIDMPAHSNAALAAYPMLACPVVDKFIGVLPGLGGNHADIIYCAGNENVYHFLQDVLDEVMALFPSRYIHLGGDEAWKTHWQQCPLCQKRIREEKLADEEDLQGYFMRRMSKYVQSKGREVMGWDELTQSQIPDDAIIFGWRGMGEAALKAARQGHRFVMTPARVMYLIRYQGPQWFEPYTYFGNNTLKDIYSYEPVGPTWNDGIKSLLMGVQGSMWTEFCNRTSDVEYMLFPRLAAVAEVGWTIPGKKDWSRFLKALDHFMERLAVKGVNFAQSMYNIQHSVTVRNGKLQVTLDCIRPDVEIAYTLDGSEPTVNSPRYVKPLIVKQSTLLKCATFYNGKRMGKMLTLPVGLNKATACTVYTDSPAKDVLINGVRGSSRSSDFEWASWENNDTICITLDLGKKTRMQKLIMGFNNSYGMGIHKPRRMEVWVSPDDRQYRKIKEQSFTETEIFRQGMFTEDVQFDLKDESRYVRIVAYGAGMNPPTHVRPEQTTKVCIDEIIIE